MTWVNLGAFVPDLLEIDGSHGEGGGQILRTALALSAITGRPIGIGNVRAGRPRPGLAAQHLTAVKALAGLCDAEVSGDALGSLRLTFAPRRPVQAGPYDLDVAAARRGGSAGSAPLVLQSVFLPLALAKAGSRVSIRGGTHVAWSPPFDYLESVWLPAMRCLGLEAVLSLEAWGWFPVGQGRITLQLAGSSGAPAKAIAPLDLETRGSLTSLSGRAVVSNLPLDIAQRMAERARSRLQALEVECEIEALEAPAACPGAGIFLTAHYQNVACGFSALGERGKRAERVADEAASALTDHWRSNAALDLHLADQVLLPLCLAKQPSRYSTEAVTRHLQSNAYVIDHFDLARVTLQARAAGGSLVTVHPKTA